MPEMRLESAVFGMSNNNHVHVHRHNQLAMDSQQIDRIRMEQMSGGVLASTLNEIGNMAGSLSSQAQGSVSIEDGWNVRRGLGILTFTITNNALMTEQLSVVGYLTGGGASVAGIEPQTLFVPVRSWSQVTRNTQNPLDGMDYAQTVVNDSTQFLMGDASKQRSLRSLRPIDIADSVIGVAALAAEGKNDAYQGSMSNELDINGITISKTHNLNPAFHSRSLIKMATAGIGPMASQFGSQYALTDALTDPGLNEMHPTENPFLRVMQASLQQISLRGFEGYTVGEIAATFENLPDVMNLNLMDESQYAIVNNVANTNEYGTSSLFELLSSELAYITIHSLLQAGLMSYCFSATNDIQEIGGISAPDGVIFIPGEALSVLNHDDKLPNRIEGFQNLLISNFFSKLNGAYQHNRTIIGVEVQSYLFGETHVKISLNGNFMDERTWVNASFAINRHSTNIGANQIAVDQANNFFDNIKHHFSS